MIAAIRRYVSNSSVTIGSKLIILFQFLYNVAQSTVVTFDDTYSLKDKAIFARQNGMAGCFTWSLDQVRPL